MKELLDRTKHALDVKVNEDSDSIYLPPSQGSNFSTTKLIFVIQELVDALVEAGYAGQAREILKDNKMVLESTAGKKIKESTSRHCAVYKAKDGNWYMELANNEYEGRDEATTYGPFSTEDAVWKYLDRFSNPGGFSVSKDGNTEVPKESPNGRPVVNPRR